MASAQQAQQQAGWDEGFGLTIRFRSFQGADLVTTSLDLTSKGIELLNVRHDANSTVATVWIPAGGVAVYEQKSVEYLAYKKVKTGKRSLDHRKLLDAIEDIRIAAMEDLWTDEHTPLPEANTELTFEAWIGGAGIPSKGKASTAAEQIARFRKTAQLEGLIVSNGRWSSPTGVFCNCGGGFRNCRYRLNYWGN